MKRLFLVPLVILLVAGLVLGGCAEPAPSPTPTPTPSPAPAPAPAAPIKIGHLRPLTGHMAITGERMVRAGEFAFEEAGYEAAGRKIEVIVADSAADAAKAVDAAKKLVEHDGVSMIIGPTVGGPQMAVSAYMTAVGVPVIFTNPAPLGIIFEGHQWTFMAGGSEAQASSPIGVFAYDELGYKTATTITGDWTPGHGFMDAFIGAFEAKGGKVIQQQYPPFDCPDFGSYLAALKDADTVVAWFDGTTAIRFLSQFDEFGIRKRMPLMACFHGSFFAPFILYQLPPTAAEAVVGEYCPTPYTPLIETDVNKRFVEAWQAKIGEAPEDTDTGPYEGVLIALAALEATGGDTTPAKIRDAILGLKLEGPQGPIRFDPETRCTIKTVYIGQVEKRGEEYVWVPAHTYPDVPSPFGFAPPPAGPPAQ